MRFRARVRRVTGRTTHLFHGEESFDPPKPVSVEIRREDEGFFLLHLDANGECFADTWHPTVEEAKAQAKFEYEIEPDDWEPVE